MTTADIESLVLPIEGYGLWKFLYGFIAIEDDLNTVRGITFYEHGETPGLGGEVDNPRWKARWVGQKVFGDDGEPKIEVIKGFAPPPAEAPYEVDGLSGATITCPRGHQSASTSGSARTASALSRRASHKGRRSLMASQAKAKRWSIRCSTTTRSPCRCWGSARRWP